MPLYGGLPYSYYRAIYGSGDDLCNIPTASPPVGSKAATVIRTRAVANRIFIRKFLIYEYLNGFIFAFNLSKVESV